MMESKQRSLGDDLAVVGAVYYLYLLPILALITGAIVKGETFRGGDGILLLVPLLNWLAYLGLLCCSKDSSLALTLLITWAMIGLGVIFVANLVLKKQHRQAAEAQIKRAEIARLERHRLENDGYRRQMLGLGEDTLGVFEAMPKHLDSAEKWLDQAESDFSDGAFAPFWDAVENAAK